MRAAEGTSKSSVGDDGIRRAEEVFSAAARMGMARDRTGSIGRRRMVDIFCSVLSLGYSLRSAVDFDRDVVAVRGPIDMVDLEAPVVEALRVADVEDFRGGGCGNSVHDSDIDRGADREVGENSWGAPPPNGRSDESSRWRRVREQETADRRASSESV